MPPPRSIYRQDLHLCWQAPSCGSSSRWTWSKGCSCCVCTQLQEGLQACVFQFTPEKNPSLVMLDCFNNVWHESSWGSISWMDGNGGDLKINVCLSSGHLWSSMEMILWLELWSFTSRPQVFSFEKFSLKKKKRHPFEIFVVVLFFTAVSTTFPKPALAYFGQNTAGWPKV